MAGIVLSRSYLSDVRRQYLGCIVRAVVIDKVKMLDSMTCGYSVLSTELILG